jgi:hypothetical protein
MIPTDYEPVPREVKNNPNRDFEELRPDSYFYNPGNHDSIFKEAAQTRDPEDEKSDRDDDVTEADSYKGRLAEIAFRERILKEYFDDDEWEDVNCSDYDFVLYGTTKIEVKARDKERKKYENLLVRMRDGLLHADVYVNTVVTPSLNVYIIGQASRDLVDVADYFPYGEYTSKEVDIKNLNSLFLVN